MYPGTLLLNAIVALVQSANRTVEAPNSPGERMDNRWELVRVLLPAAGAVHHVRHGFGRPPKREPVLLTGDQARAAAFVTALVAAELHTSLKEDAAFQLHHDLATAEAEDR